MEASFAGTLLEAANPILSMAFMYAYVSVLTLFREPVRTWKRIWTVLFAGMAVVAACIVLFAGYETYLRLSFFVMMANCAVTLFASKPGILRAFFAQLTASYIGMIAQANVTLAEFLFDFGDLASLAVRCASLALMYAFLRAFAHRYMRVLHTLDHGWGILCLAPAIVFFVNLFAINQLMAENPVQAIVVQYGMLGVCAVFYAVVFLLFAKVQEENETKQGQSTLALQVTALRSRLEALREADRRERIERHDVRHRLNLAVELLQRGDVETALQTLGAADQRLSEATLERWCAHPLLDAVFGLYFAQAKAHGVRVDARLAVPEELPVPADELSVVVANALENAIKACDALPVERREIVCRAISAPQLMLSFENPCEEAVVFGENGLPRTDEPGHGFGMQSLAAFCEKHGAVCDCTAANGTFRLRIAL